MSVLSLFLVCALIGFLAWVIVKLIPMPANIANVIYIAALAIVIFYVLSAFGILGHIGSARVPTIH